MGTRLNLRRLQILISLLLTAVASSYGIYWLVPKYLGFYETYEERRLWDDEGFDDPAIRQKYYDRCMAGFRSEEQQQVDSLCSRPYWDPLMSKTYRVESVLAFLSSQGSRILLYVGFVIILLPWGGSLLLVRVLPSAARRLGTWLTAP